MNIGRPQAFWMLQSVGFFANPRKELGICFIGPTSPVMSGIPRNWEITSWGKAGGIFGRSAALVDSYIMMLLCLLWGFPKMGTPKNPKNGWFIRENLLKWMM